MATTTSGRANDRFEKLISIDMEIGTFVSDWAYCDRLSTYLARMVSHNRTDSLLYANLLSSALNELLETVHRAHGPAGRFACAILRSGARDRIELTIPNDAVETDFYTRAIDIVRSPNVAEEYRAALFHEGPLDPAVSLMELAVDYNARLKVEATDTAVRLSAELTLEDTAA